MCIDLPRHTLFASNGFNTCKTHLTGSRRHSNRGGKKTKNERIKNQTQNVCMFYGRGTKKKWKGRRAAVSGVGMCRSDVTIRALLWKLSSLVGTHQTNAIDYQHFYPIRHTVECTRGRHVVGEGASARGRLPQVGRRITTSHIYISLAVVHNPHHAVLEACAGLGAAAANVPRSLTAFY